MPDMRSVITSLVVSALFVSLSANAACSRNEHGVFEDVPCAADALAKADRELNELYRKVLSQVTSEEQKKLRASQRAWLAYRDSSSTFIYAVEGDGSAGRMVAANQREQATRARIKELRSWLR